MRPTQIAVMCGIVALLSMFLCAVLSYAKSVTGDITPIVALTGSGVFFLGCILIGLERTINGLRKDIADLKRELEEVKGR